LVLRSEKLKLREVNFNPVYFLQVRETPLSYLLEFLEQQRAEPHFSASTVHVSLRRNSTANFGSFTLQLQKKIKYAFHIVLCNQHCC